MAESFWRTLFLGRRGAVLGRALSPIGKAPDGAVRIEGVASCDRPLLTAPFSGRPCIFYDIQVKATASAANISLREVRGLELTLDDGTGSARVVFQDTGNSIPLREGPRHLTCLIDRAVVFQNGAEGEEEIAKIDALVTAHGLAKRGLVGQMPGEWVASEGIITAGDLVSVAGRGSREIAAKGVSQDYRTPPWQYLIRASESAPATIVKLQR